MNRIDLHCHSTASDGTLTPTQLVAEAARVGLTAFALTDHDTTAGIAEASIAAKNYDIELIHGIELSSDDEGTDIHIVGLDIHAEREPLRSALLKFQTLRRQRNEKMIQRMANAGIPISYEQVVESCGDGVWTRGNLGRYLIDKGCAKDMTDAFARYLSTHSPYYIPRKKMKTAEAVRLLSENGAIPILAHPLQYHYEPQRLRRLAGELKEAGLLGMEVYYSTYTEEASEDLLRLADETGLLPSGGSDFHGRNKPTISLGTGTDNLNIPYELIENLRSARRKTL